jgi:hypothetical protein
VGLFRGTDRQVSKPTLYDESWVAKLFRGFQRNLTIPLRFVCLTDFPPEGFEEGIEVVSFLETPKDWFCLNEAFRPDLGGGRRLFTGLDTVVVGSMDEIVAAGNGFTWLRNPLKPGYLHDSNAVVVWDQDTVGNKIWDLYTVFGGPDSWRSKPACQMRSPIFGPRVDRTAPSEMLFWAEALRQMGVEPEYFDDLTPGQCVSYNVEVKKRLRDKEEDHPDVRLIYFSGQHYPARTDIPRWIKEHWV